MMEHGVFTTKEAAMQLNVHARTVRKWIDAFSDYVRPQLNKRGHYQLTADGLQALQNIRKHLRTGNKSLKQVREELVLSGEITTNHRENMENISQERITDELDAIKEQLTRVETVQQNTVKLLDQLQTVLEDVHMKQEQLKFEIRNATFEQRLNAADDNKTKRKKDGVLRLSQLFR